MRKQAYIAANKEWLLAKAAEDGVNQLSKGVYYKVLSKGNESAKHPTSQSVVTVHYVGRTIDGRCFDRSGSGVAPAFRLSELIDGWKIALQHMTVGDKWELYLSADVAYGRFSQPGIPAGSTLIFEIELMSVV